MACRALADVDDALRVIVGDIAVLIGYMLNVDPDEIADVFGGDEEAARDARYASGENGLLVLVRQCLLEKGDTAFL